MKLVRVIDVDGFFIKDALVGTTDKLLHNYIDGPPPKGFIRPKWDGTKWVEGYVPTLAEVAERDKNKQKALRKELMHTGKEYLTTGVVVPFTGDDALALIQVKNGFDLGNNRTIIHWSNGEKLPITPEELLPLMRWFSYERNQFYLD